MNSIKIVQRIFRKYISVILSAALISCGIPPLTVMAEETEYIVKYNKYGLKHFAEDCTVPLGFANKSELDALINANAVEWYEKDTEVTLPDTDESADFSLFSSYYTDTMWHLDMIDADAAYESGYMGQGVKIAVIDTGVNEHNALKGRILEGYNYLNDSTDTADANGHGTNVAGLIAGCDDVEMVGTAPKAEIVPLKCFSGSQGSSVMMTRAILEAVNKYDCDIINLSVCLKNEVESVKEAVDYAVENGVIVVAAAGNDGTSIIRYPAYYDNVISVGAVKQNGELSWCSNYNDGVTLTAPGESITTTSYRGKYTTCTGTSFSAPLVTGAVADLLSANPYLTPENIMEIIKSNSADMSTEGYDNYYGWGILNVRNYLTAINASFPLEISDPEETDGALKSVIKNKSKITVECDVYAAVYTNDGVLSDVAITPLTLEAQGEAEITVPSWGKRTIYLFNKGTICPLAEAKKLQ